MAVAGLENFLKVDVRRLTRNVFPQEAGPFQIDVSIFFRPLSNSNLVPRVLSYVPYEVREREILENAGHVAPEQN